MRLLSLTVRNYRVHKDLTVNFDPSRTLIGGPNESGKSTLAEAAHRALFLRAKTGGNVRTEMVSTLHNGDPEVILAFEAGGARWELEKRFAGAKGSTLLTAHGGAALRDDEAEAKLADLLKSETAGGRGAAGLLPNLWSHLWVWQGRAGEDPSAHTTPHKERLVQHLQQNGVAAVLQSATDQRVASRIADSCNELFTNTGRPKAGSKPELARARLEEAEATLEKARENAARLAQAADDHARAERDIAEVTALLPKLRNDRCATETKLREVEALRRDEQAHRQAAQTATTRREELETHDRTIRDLQTRLAAGTAALQPADTKLATLTGTEQSARTASQAAERSLKEAAEILRHARLHHDLANAAVAAFEKADAHQALAARAAEAATLQDELTALRADFAKLPVLDTKDLARLRKLETTAAQASAALDAMATGIELIESAAPVELDGKPLAPGETRILTDSGELLVGNGSQGVKGTYCGADEGRKRLSTLLAGSDLSTEAGIATFVELLIKSLLVDERDGKTHTNVKDVVSKGQTTQSLYDFVYGLDYLRPRCSLGISGKALFELSPGERGALLLVFYLLVDQNDSPLIIDQPEENLDNQTVFKLLVPCIKEAKRRRQIIIITHNPNLAVVCDAEQIICCSIDKHDGNRLRYVSGAIENPEINSAIVDILEGTRPAFDNRGSKYLESVKP